MEITPTVQRRPDRDELVAAIRECKGDISAVARRYNVSRVTVYAWIDRDAITIDRRVTVR